MLWEIWEARPKMLPSCHPTNNWRNAPTSTIKTSVLMESSTGKDFLGKYPYICIFPSTWLAKQQGKKKPKNQQKHLCHWLPGYLPVMVTSKQNKSANSNLFSLHIHCLGWNTNCLRGSSSYYLAILLWPFDCR